MSFLGLDFSREEMAFHDPVRYRKVQSSAGGSGGKEQIEYYFLQILSDPRTGVLKSHHHHQTPLAV
jgi:hypothetical protein